MKNKQLLSLLERARRDEDIYIIARAVIMLRARGYQTLLSEAEKTEILCCLENARKSKGMLPLEPGYELARWIFLSKYLFPEEKVEASEDDTRLIQEACNSYCDDRILKQVASLVHMSKILNIEISITSLPPKKRKLVQKLAAKLK